LTRSNKEFPEHLRQQVVSARRSIGRVNELLPDQKEPRLRGTCFIIGTRYAITCDHVVAVDPPARESDEWQQSGQFQVVFEGSLPKKHSVHRVLRGGDGIDLAILELHNESGLEPIGVAFEPGWGVPFCTFGYPLEPGGDGAGIRGVEIEGSMLGPTSISRGSETYARVELRAERVIEGFSGAPVLVEYPNGAICAVGCISETVSDAFNDVASCTPLGAFVEARPIKHLFSNIIESSTHNESLDARGIEADEAANWEFTSAIMNRAELAQQLNVSPRLVAEVATEIFSTVQRMVKSSRISDEEDARALETVIRALRTKYQKLGIGPRTAAESFRSLMKSRTATPSEYNRLRGVASVVSADMARIGSRLLIAAKNHGAAIDQRVVVNYSAGVVESLPPKIDDAIEISNWDRYGCENAARILESATQLIEFDIGRLSRGYLQSGRPLDTTSLLSPVLFAIPEGIDSVEPAIVVFSANETSKLTDAGRFVSRKTRLGRSLLTKRASGELALFADSDQYLYRWDLRSPTPTGEFRTGTDDYYGILDFKSVAHPDGPEIGLTSVGGDFWRLDAENLTLREMLRGVGSPEAFWFDEPSRCYRGIFTPDLSGESVFLKEMSQNGSQLARFEIEDLGKRYADLFCLPLSKNQISELELDESTLRAGESVVSLSPWRALSFKVDEYLGSPCILVKVQCKSRFGEAIFIVDPDNLQPLRTPVVELSPISDMRIANHSNSWWLVATLEHLPGLPSGIAVWDISRAAEDGRPKRLGIWHKGNDDLRKLFVVPHSSGFDAYFCASCTQHIEEWYLEFWRFKWTDKSCERILKLPWDTGWNWSLISR
jgi:hypothetical protein